VITVTLSQKTDAWLHAGAVYKCHLSDSRQKGNSSMTAHMPWLAISYSAHELS